MIEIISQLNLCIESFMEEVETFVDEMDRDIFEQSHVDDINQMHKKLLKLNRFLKPQIHALNAFSKANLKEFEPLSIALANQLDVINRIVESIDFYLAQIDLINIRINQRQTEKMNHNTYILSIIAGIFLPLGFLTGLFGINIGGMPGVDNDLAFYWFCGWMIVTVIFEYVILRKLKFL